MLSLLAHLDLDLKGLSTEIQSDSQSRVQRLSKLDLRFVKLQRLLIDETVHK